MWWCRQHRMVLHVVCGNNFLAAVMPKQTCPCMPASYTQVTLMDCEGAAQACLPSKSYAWRVYCVYYTPEHEGHGVLKLHWFLA